MPTRPLIETGTDMPLVLIIIISSIIAIAIANQAYPQVRIFDSSLSASTSPPSTHGAMRVLLGKCGSMLVTNANFVKIASSHIHDE